MYLCLICFDWLFDELPIPCLVARLVDADKQEQGRSMPSPRRCCSLESRRKENKDELLRAVLKANAV